MSVNTKPSVKSGISKSSYLNANQSKSITQKQSLDPTATRPSIIKSHAPSLSSATGIAHLTNSESKRNSEL